MSSWRSPRSYERSKGALDGRARRVEERGHERRPQRGVAGAVGNQRADHPRRHAFERGYEDLETLVEVAVGCNRCRGAVAGTASRRRAPRHEELAARPPTVDGRLGCSSPPGDLFERQAAIPRSSSRFSSVAPESPRADRLGPAAARTPRPGPRRGAGSLVAAHARSGTGRGRASAGAEPLRQAWQRERDHRRGQDPGRHNEGRRGDAPSDVPTRRASPQEPAGSGIRDEDEAGQTDGAARLRIAVEAAPERRRPLRRGDPGAGWTNIAANTTPSPKPSASERGDQGEYEVSGDIPRQAPAPHPPTASAARRVVPHRRSASSIRPPSARAEQPQSRRQQEPDPDRASYPSTS